MIFGSVSYAYAQFSPRLCFTSRKHQKTCCQHHGVLKVISPKHLCELGCNQLMYIERYLGKCERSQIFECPIRVHVVHHQQSSCEASLRLNVQFGKTATSLGGRAICVAGITLVLRHRSREQFPLRAAISVGRITCDFRHCIHTPTVRLCLAKWPLEA